MGQCCFRRDNDDKLTGYSRVFTEQTSQLQDIIDKPVEREWLELKSWVDPRDKAVRAVIARHIPAPANYEGGYLVFRAAHICSNTTELNLFAFPVQSLVGIAAIRKMTC